MQLITTITLSGRVISCVVLIYSVWRARDIFIAEYLYFWRFLHCRQWRIQQNLGIITLVNTNTRAFYTLVTTRLKFSRKWRSGWPWWRHQMETFSALLAICVGNSPVPGEFNAQRPVTLSFDVFFDLRLNKRLSKQSRGWRFETLPIPLWRHRNAWTHSADRSIKLSGSHRTQTQTSEVRWAALKKTSNGRRSQLNQFWSYKPHSKFKPTWNILKILYVSFKWCFWQK